MKSYLSDLKKLGWFLLGVGFAAVLCVLCQSCATRTVTISKDGTINATVTVLGYCPEAQALRIVDGKRSVDTGADSSGVGGVVTGLGRGVVEVLKP